MNIRLILFGFVSLLQLSLCMGMNEGWTEVKAREQHKKTQSNESKLYYACARNNRCMVDQLLRQGHVNVDAVDNEGNSFLSQIACKKYYNDSAAIAKSIDIAGQLLDGGANINHGNNKGQTALMGAAHFGHMQRLRFLAGSGADIEQRDEQGSTALIHAASGGQSNVVKALINYKANVNAQDNEKLRTPLHWAIRMSKGCERKKGKQHDQNVVLSIVQELLAAGANPRIKDKEGKTPLYWAEEYKLIEVAKALRAAASNNRNDGK